MSDRERGPGRPVSLPAPARDPLDLGADQTLHDIGQVVVEPRHQFSPEDLIFRLVREIHKGEH